jgi:uncharacterized protein YrrD
MRLGKDLIGKPIISITDGRLLGTVKDIYINDQLYWLSGLFLKNEGMIRRKATLIPRESVVVYGLDAILVKNSESITTDKEHDDAEQWVRLEKLRGRPVDTPGGTKVGNIGDVMLDEEGRVTGFVLGKILIEGPIAENGTIPRESLVDTGNDGDDAMTVDLAQIERIYQGIEPEDADEEDDNAPEVDSD